MNLVTSGIDSITADAVVDNDGVEHSVDVIVFATGFDTNQTLPGWEVHGREGRELHDYWAGEPCGYYGISVPDFPNFFMIMGPNTGGVTNGSISVFAEAGIRYVLEALRQLLTTGRRTIEPTQEAFDAFNRIIDEKNRQMAWGVSWVNNWYQSESGRVSLIWPLSVPEYWRETRRPNPGDHRYDA
ncbi:hypothetical protein [Streptosporangium amethystogenes]|uniref:hypothetical protein n=1 Tax=Streptosporangium amethystogenes TaxID=2002 RepID=UPI0004C9ADC9|nr:hypothetical protein [Streptosporangium amethystogenes]